MNWDIVSLPSFPEAPGKSYQYDIQIAAVSALSKHKDDAFKVVEVMASNEVQRQISAGCFVPVLSEVSVQQAFCSNEPKLKGKNLNAIFKATPALPSTSVSKWDSNIGLNNLSQTMMKKIVNNGVDVNTALREAEEEANQYIQANP